MSNGRLPTTALPTAFVIARYRGLTADGFSGIHLMNSRNIITDLVVNILQCGLCLT